jgi:hypothetical protein
MSAQVPSLREAKNNGVVQQISDIDRAMAMGDLMGMLVQSLAPTEAAAAVSANAKTLANAASMVYDVVATAGTVTGRKRIKIGGSDVVPVSGEVVWSGPGSSSMRFAAADAVTASNFLYARADGNNTLTSLGQRLLGQRD